MDNAQAHPNVSEQECETIGNQYLLGIGFDGIVEHMVQKGYSREYAVFATSYVIDLLYEAAYGWTCYA